MFQMQSTQYNTTLFMYTCKVKQYTCNLYNVRPALSFLRLQVSATTTTPTQNKINTADITDVDVDVDVDVVDVDIDVDVVVEAFGQVICTMPSGSIAANHLHVERLILILYDI